MEGHSSPGPETKQRRDPDRNLRPTLMRKIFNWLTGPNPASVTELQPEELEDAKRRLRYLEQRASLLGISVAREEPQNGE
jgi:hypothetical protein